MCLMILHTFSMCLMFLLTFVMYIGCLMILLDFIVLYVFNDFTLLVYICV